MVVWPVWGNSRGVVPRAGGQVHRPDGLFSSARFVHEGSDDAVGLALVHEEWWVFERRNGDAADITTACTLFSAVLPHSPPAAPGCTARLASAYRPCKQARRVAACLGSLAIEGTTSWLEELRRRRLEGEENDESHGYKICYQIDSLPI